MIGSVVQPDTPRPRSLRDNWWWSGALWTIGGGAIIWYQLPVLRGEMEGFWGNWAMAAIGLAIGVTGLFRLYRDWRSEETRLTDALDAHPEVPEPDDGHRTSGPDG